MSLLVDMYMLDIVMKMVNIWFKQVDIYESRSFIGGKVGSFVDKRGNHIEMGLHVFFGCYNNLFRLMKKVNPSYLSFHSIRISSLNTDGNSFQKVEPYLYLAQLHLKFDL